jgi:spermidine synthase
MSWRLTFLLVGVGIFGRCEDVPAGVVYETTSPYHHIQVIDRDGARVLSFDGTIETRMSLKNPLAGHFEYVEYFHMPWLWNDQMTNVLMLGLGGGSVQRAYQHFYPGLTVETAEIDSAVVRIARDYFGFQESPKQRVHVADGRMFVRRTESAYGAIIVDAYVKNRYGSVIPYHLATKEFFELANQRLTTNGVIAYNVIGTMHGWKADILGSVYRTMAAVFPQVYLFPAKDSLNVVVVGTKLPQRMDVNSLRQRANALVQSGRVAMPTFAVRASAVTPGVPATFLRCPILTDDYAPVDSLANSIQR